MRALVGRIPRVALVAVVGSMLMSALFIADTASANNSTYFDNNTVLITGETRYVQRASVRVKVYFNNPSGNTITISDLNYCPSSSFDLMQNGDWHASNPGSLADSARVTLFNFSRQNTNGTYSSLYNAEGRYNCGVAAQSYTYNVPTFAENQRDPSTGKFVIALTANHVNQSGGFDGIQNGFRLQANNGGIISHAAGAGHEVTFERAGNPASYHNYTVRFGSSCEVRTAGTATIFFYDLDNQQAGVQPNALNIRLRVADKGQNNWSFIPITFGGVQHLTWTPPVLTPNTNTPVYFRAEPNKRYELLLNNVYGNNTVQFGLPYDGIYYDPGCMEWQTAQESRVRIAPNATHVSGVWGNYSAGYATTAHAGQYVRFMHRIHNAGSSALPSGGVSAATQTFYPANPAIYSNDANLWANAGSDPATQWSPAGIVMTRHDLGADASYYYYHGRSPADTGQGNLGVRVPQNAAIGSYICQRIGTPYRPGDLRWHFSVPACVRIVEVPYDYTLTPRIESSIATISEGDTQIDDIRARIDKSGSTDSRSANYGVARFVVRDNSSTVITASPIGSGVAVDRNGTDPSGVMADWPCRVVQAIAQRNASLDIDTSGCNGQELARVNRTVITGDGTDVPLQPNDISSLNLAVGDRVCYVTMVSAYSAPYDYATFRYSQPHCIVVAKNPKVQFWGGDVRSQQQVITSHSSSGGAMYGSWAEYAIMSGQLVSSASGAGLAADNGGRIGVVGRPIEYNRLTFTNTASVYGNFLGAIGASSLPTEYIDGSGSTLDGSSVSLLGLNGVYLHEGGALAIDTSDIEAGRTVIIKARSATVTITGNINYVGNFSAGTMPQVVIIARNIVIDPGVTEVNAWLIAQGEGNNGYVSTCGAVSAPGSWLNNIDACGEPLRVNGPIIANHLYLRRTHGSERESRNTPAEVLNLRPDAYIWAQDYFGRTNSVRTDYVRELPPRF